MVSSLEAEAIRFPRGDQATHRTSLEWPCRTDSFSPSQIRTVRSTEHEQSRLLSRGDQAAQFTPPLWPQYTYSHEPLRRFQIRTEPSNDVDAIRHVSRRQAT